MKKDVSRILVISLVLIAGLTVAGCVQDNGTTGAQPGTSGGQLQGPQDNASGSARQFRDTGMLSNVTVLAAAADKLGVSEQELQDALESTKNATSGRPDLNAAAQKIGVTREDLTDALGFPAGGERFRGDGYNATRVPG
jgi:hypothetical protein